MEYEGAVFAVDFVRAIALERLLDPFGRAPAAVVSIRRALRHIV